MEADVTLTATECAVSAFLRTFPSPCARERTALFTSRTRKTSNNLPVELLLIIFELVYKIVYQEYWESAYDERPEQDAMSPSLFPYALASVCSLWRDVALSVPKFWERVVILIDPPATPLSAAVSLFSWSRDRQLDVTVTRQAFHAPVDRRHERSQIVAIMNIIRPHIHRIRELRINVTFSSSLPSFPTDFHGNATMLQVLELNSKEDDGSSDRSEWGALTERDEFLCPELASLIVGGRMYYEVCRGGTRWTDKIVDIDNLTISHFQPRPGESFSTREFVLPLTALKDFQTLRIVDVVLHPSPELVDALDLACVEHLTFEGLRDFRVMDQIIHPLSEPNYISFIRCTFEHITDASRRFGDRTGLGGDLRLVEISCDLAPLLRLWIGDTLDITDCLSFDDVLLDTMAYKENEVFNYVTGLSFLTICNCSNFSIAALRRFVQSRITPVLDGGEVVSVITGTPSIQCLRLYGNVPLVSRADMAWFATNVSIFHHS